MWVTIMNRFKVSPCRETRLRNHATSLRNGHYYGIIMPNSNSLN